MSRSVRKSLRRALEGLNDLLEACERYPDARAEVVAAVGEEGFERLRQARATVREASAALETVRDTDGPADEGGRGER
ncbi:MAG TPA: hypothetical protein VGE02_10180 [Gemmatimonadales bacterium]